VLVIAGLSSGCTRDSTLYMADYELVDEIGGC